jgi:hypothetical protein
MEVAQRAADSAGFRNCPKLRAFLLYVCENTLCGKQDNVREQVIGAEVFGRPPDYNVREDNIVRVEARELRKRLESYFAAEGRQEPFVIEIPKGGYIPVFRPVEPVPEAQTAAMAAAARQRMLVPLLAAVLLVALTAVAWLSIDNSRLRAYPPHPSGARASVAAADYACYRDILGPLGDAGQRETLLVLSNPRVVLYTGVDSRLPESQPTAPVIAAPKELDVPLSGMLNNLDRDLPYHYLVPSPTEYTGMGEAVSAFHLARLMQYLRSPLRLTQGRFLNWDHVQKQSLIVLGGPQINDWTFRYTQNTGFRLENGRVVNTKPLAGEPPEWVRSGNPKLPSADGTDYAIIKMLNPPYDVRMLLLAGSSSAATAGAGEFFTTPAKMRAVHDRLRANAPDGVFPSSWEIVLRVEVRDGFPAETAAIAYRPAAAGH